MLNTCQTDTESVEAEKTKLGTGIELPEAPKPVQSTQGPNAPTSNHPLGPSVAASEPEVTVVPQKAPEPAKEVPPPTTEAPNPITEAPKLVEEPTQPMEEVPKPSTQEPQVGEKRDLDSMANQAPAEEMPPAPEPTAEKVDGPESKKQKTEQEPTKDTNGTVPAPSTTTTAPAAAPPEEPKKTGPTKKEKIKEAVKKIIPGDGPGTRTRSRTKDT